MKIKFIGRLLGSDDVREAIKHAVNSGDVVAALIPDGAHLISRATQDNFGHDFFIAMLDAGEKVHSEFVDHGNFKEVATFA